MKERGRGIEVRPALNKTGEAVLVELDLAYSQLVSLVWYNY